jgi:hypothetical protein
MSRGGECLQAVNEPLKRALNRFGPCDFFVAEQVFTLTEPVTITAKSWHFESAAQGLDRRGS